jgi:hypothetical protein
MILPFNFKEEKENTQFDSSILNDYLEQNGSLVE